jgi:hypothetical protein
LAGLCVGIGDQSVDLRAHHEPAVYRPVHRHESGTLERRALVARRAPSLVRGSGAVDAGRFALRIASSHGHRGAW